MECIFAEFGLPPRACGDYGVSRKTETKESIMSYRELIRREALAAAASQTCTSFAARAGRTQEAARVRGGVAQSVLTNALINDAASARDAK